jgi:hypothetical protein
VDEIVISLPRDRAFGTVADLVLGGVAARQDLTVDALDDLQLALTTLLEQDEDGDERELSIVLRIDGSAIAASVGPFEGAALAELEQAPGEALGLRRLLDAVVDRVTVERRDGSSWVELRKTYAAAESA